jgi:hypothetical protein
MRVADCHVPEEEPHEIRQRDNIRRGSERLVHAIWRLHPERYVPAPLPVIKAIPAKPAFVVPPIPNGYVLPPLPTKGNKILHLVAEAMEVGVEVILSSSRVARIVHCRALVATTLRGRGWSYPQIGRLLKRDHSSVINSCDKIDIYCRRDEDCRDVYAALAELRGGK